jgi:hypothetical protein
MNPWLFGAGPHELKPVRRMKWSETRRFAKLMFN